ncbi:hypothetical protein J2Z21_009494 [Streptomyces griseochromogenes]|uniref:Core-binding (CB) domain-containing protein n=1 Tax=Streptomyces griseochromogenes TaxID=68214 RepID=A0ABS4MAU4_9ACTN|nr:site-specific integrase [Streptomyces griseochromogenes]MBP2056476.1 hypothetical protein [Streptomyces griseochromogenes]
MRAQDRARRAGTRPRSNHTLETALATMRDLAVFLINARGKTDWSLVDVHDIESFLAVLPRARKRRLTVLRQFFRFARAQKLVLVDPTRGLIAKEANGFHVRTLTLDQQRDLFRRWTTDEHVHPHETLHVHDDCGFPSRMIRSTRLIDLVNAMDAKLVAAAFGMDPQATLIYLADRVDPGRLPPQESR